MTLLDFILNALKNPTEMNDWLVFSDWLQEYITHPELDLYLKRLRDTEQESRLGFLFDLGLKFGKKSERKIISKVKRDLRKGYTKQRIRGKKLKWTRFLELHHTEEIRIRIVNAIIIECNIDMDRINSM